jgi:hypothetical protein
MALRQIGDRRLIPQRFQGKASREQPSKQYRDETLFHRASSVLGLSKNLTTQLLLGSPLNTTKTRGSLNGDYWRFQNIENLCCITILKGKARFDTARPSQNVGQAADSRV